MSGAVLAGGERHSALHRAGDGRADERGGVSRKDHKEEAPGARAGAARLLVCDGRMERGRERDGGGRAVRTGRGLPLRALLHLRAVRPAALYAVHRGVLDVRVRRARLALPARRGRDAHGVRGRENGPRRAGADRHFDGAAVSAVYERPCQGRERQGEHSGESGAGGRVVRGHSRLRRAGELDGIFRAGVHPRLRVCIEVNEDGKE